MSFADEQFKGSQRSSPLKAEDLKSGLRACRENKTSSHLFGWRGVGNTAASHCVLEDGSSACGMYMKRRGFVSTLAV